MTTYNEELLRIEKQRLQDDLAETFSRSRDYEKRLAQYRVDLDRAKEQRDKAEDRCDLLIEELAEVKTELDQAQIRIEELQAQVPITPPRPMPKFEAGQRWIDDMGWVYIILSIKGNTIEYDLRSSVHDTSECPSADSIEYFLGMYNKGNLTLLPPVEPSVKQPKHWLKVGQVWVNAGEDGNRRIITKLEGDQVSYDFRYNSKDGHACIFECSVEDFQNILDMEDASLEGSKE